MKTKITHSLHDYIDLYHGEVRLFRYVYEPKTKAYESPKPYFHPLSTLAGNKVSIFRPYDHVWNIRSFERPGKSREDVADAHERRNGLSGQASRYSCSPSNSRRSASSTSFSVYSA